eukprot:TRINITY_DN41235_c0_g1_i2.p1 TRINITY_DN41235_c0_g1~~TRINITY_DN41235_c0_g1_i2.p1  ORF type:complete len:619 (+),score=66.26 TRINITY_DN41235_c0_g1_i2:240-1859(+)
MDYINLNEVLIAEPLRDAGYATAMFGKWHSGTTPGYNPWDRGFDLSYVTFLYTFIDNLVKKNGYDMQTYGWVEDWLADRIIEYLQERQRDGRPFFILWTPMSIHQGRMYQWEWYEDFIAPKQYIDKYWNQVPGDIAKVFGAIEYFDSVLGRVMQKLTEMNFDDNTVVMFFGDNGPLLYSTDHRWGQQRMQRVPSQMENEKGFIEENGIRNFFFVRGTNQFPAGQQVDKNVGVIDIFPTIMQLAGLPQNGGSPHKLDGVSFVPLLCDPNNWSHSERSLFFHEVLKNSLGPNEILQLDDNRQVWKEQQLLKLHKGGLYGQGFFQFTALKYKNYKFVRGGLFDLQATAWKENNGNSLWSQDWNKASELNNWLYNEVANWWNNILSEPGSFQKPTFLIGYQQQYISPVRLYAAIDRSPWSITIKDQAVSGFKTSGDFVSCYVKVMTAGQYRVVLQFGWTGYKGARVKISVGSYEEIQKGEAAAVERKLDHNGPMDFGYINLKQTPNNKQDEVMVQLTAREQQDNWSEVFSWLSDIEFQLVQQY